MNEPPVINTTEARQGVTGHNVRYVLLISCALVIIAFAAVAVVMAH
jgi:hypothetical protein